MALHSKKRFKEWEPASFDGLFEWDFLRPAFMGTRIRPMDFDCVIERNSHVLIIDTKAPGEKMDQGQKITLTDQWKNKPKTTVFMVSGKTPMHIDGLAIYRANEHPKEGMVGDRPLRTCIWWDVLYMVRRWFCMANGEQPPRSKQHWTREINAWLEIPETQDDLWRTREERKAKNEIRRLVTTRIKSVRCLRCMGAGCDHCGGSGDLTIKWWATKDQFVG